MGWAEAPSQPSRGCERFRSAKGLSQKATERKRLLKSCGPPGTAGRPPPGAPQALPRPSPGPGTGARASWPQISVAPGDVAVSETAGPGSRPTCPGLQAPGPRAPRLVRLGPRPWPGPPAPWRGGKGTPANALHACHASSQGSPGPRDPSGCASKSQTSTSLGNTSPKASPRLPPCNQLNGNPSLRFRANFTSLLPARTQQQNC